MVYCVAAALAAFVYSSSTHAHNASIATYFCSASIGCYHINLLYAAVVGVVALFHMSCYFCHYALDRRYLYTAQCSTIAELSTLRYNH
jgi:hypothetical protein